MRADEGRRRLLLTASYDDDDKVQSMYGYETPVIMLSLLLLLFTRLFTSVYVLFAFYNYRQYNNLRGAVQIMPSDDDAF